MRVGTCFRSGEPELKKEIQKYNELSPSEKVEYNKRKKEKIINNLFFKNDEDNSKNKIKKLTR